MEQPNRNIHFSLDDLDGGSISEQVMTQIQRVADDIFDPNTDPKTKRSVTLKITMNSNDDLKTINLSTQVSTKLAPSNKTGTTLLGGLNANGEAELSELKSAARGQMMMDTKTGDMLTDTGLPVVNETSPDEVIDMRTGRPVQG